MSYELYSSLLAGHHNITTSLNTIPPPSQTFITNNNLRTLITTSNMHTGINEITPQCPPPDIPSLRKVGGTDFFIDLVKQSKCSSTMMATPRLTQIEELRAVRDVGVGGGVGWRVVSHLIMTVQDYNIINIYTTIRLHHNKYIQGKRILDKFLHMSTSLYISSVYCLIIYEACWRSFTQHSNLQDAGPAGHS